VQPLALPRDPQQDDRWLAFVGSPEVAVAAWRVLRKPTGEVSAEPVQHWPAGVRVLGGTSRGGVAYVLLESLPVLDQPGGMHGVFVDAWPDAGPYDASPLALANIADVAQLDERVGSQPRPGSDQNGALFAALRAASGSAASLVRSLSSGGADVGTSWQNLFARATAHVDASPAESSPFTEHVLAVTRAALSAQACGATTCEAWTDRGHAVVRFALEDGRWALRSVWEDAPLPAQGTGTRRVVEAIPAGDATARLLWARARTPGRVLGEAPLTADGGTIGVGLADLAPDSPLVVVDERGAPRIFALPVGSLRASASDASWEAAFADVDGDGRTDVVVRLSGRRADGVAVSWAQAFLAPPPSVQATSLEADLASALATIDAADAGAAARAAVELPHRAVSREDACRLLASASTPAGFRRAASPGASLLLFHEPGLPTWRPRIVPAARVAADEASALGGHCAELACSASRPYCAWTGGANSLHAWFGWRNDRLELVGAADYDGE
jgi:hypothetical protein